MYTNLYTNEEVRKGSCHNKRNVCKYIPLEFIHYLNLTKSSCPTCNTTNTFAHLQDKHHCQLPDAYTLLQMCRRIQESKGPRKQCLERAKLIIEPFLKKFQFYVLGKKKNF